jgi:hypothetical protein
MEKRPTDLKALFLHKVLSRRGGTIRFIRWSFFNPLENFLNLKLSRLRDSGFQLL